MDNDYEQSEEEAGVDDEVEKNLDGMLRRNKGKGVDIDIDGGFVCQDSDSDCEAEYGTKSYVQSSDSEDVDLEQLNIGDGGKRKVKKVLPNLPEFRPSTDMSITQLSNLGYCFQVVNVSSKQ